MAFIDKIESNFVIKTQDKLKFGYVGLNMKKPNDEVIICQDNDVKDSRKIEHEKNGHSTGHLNERKVTYVWQIIGKQN